MPRPGVDDYEAADKQQTVSMSPFRLNVDSGPMPFLGLLWLRSAKMPSVHPLSKLTQPLHADARVEIPW